MLTLQTQIVSGLSAAHTIYLAGGNVVVLDKQGKLKACIERIDASLCV
jgi:hypothetical protein